MKNVFIIILGILLILINNYLGHINPPFSISWTPVLIGLITGLIMYFTDFRISVKFGLITILIISNDVLIKLFSGGTHDWEGAGWISVFLFIGLIISLILITVYGFTKQKKLRKKYFLNLFATGLIIFFYLSYFNSLGMVWISYPTKSIKLAKERRVFMSEIELSDSLVLINKNDTFIIKKGWIEKQVKYNHKALVKRAETTNKVYWTLLVEGNFGNLNYYDNSIYYKLKESDSKGLRFLENNITLTFDKLDSNYHIEFYNSDRVKINELEINIKNGLQQKI